MKEFDIDLKHSEFSDSSIDSEQININNINKKNNTTNEPPKWQTDLNQFTNLVQQYGKQYAESQNQSVQYQSGKKVKILGLHPIVFVSVSLAITLAGVITIIYLGKKRQLN